MKKIIIAAGMLLFLCSSSAFAQNIGFAQPQRILDSMPEREAVEQELEEYYLSWEQDYNDLYERYSENLYLYQESRDELSDAQIEQEEQRLNEMAEELTFMQQEFGMMFEERRVELLSPLIDTINEHIEEVAEERGLDYVFQSETSDAEPMFFIMENERSTIDLTDEIIARLSS
jgi:Skp family chaperone for outer membrane proteins